MSRGEAVKRTRVYNDKHLKKISKIVGPVSDAVQSGLELVAARYRADENNLGKMPPSKVEEYLVRLDKALERVDEVIGDGIPYEVEMWLGYPGYFDHLKDAKLICHAAIGQIKTGKSGRKPNYPLIFLLSGLSKAYNDAVGRTDKLTKEKAAFFQACLQPLDIKLSKDQLRWHYREVKGRVLHPSKADQ
jgi:hypothetical protein